MTIEGMLPLDDRPTGSAHPHAPLWIIQELRHPVSQILCILWFGQVPRFHVLHQLRNPPNAERDDGGPAREAFNHPIR